MSNDPILLEFPDRFETERLQLRTLLPGDGAALHEAVIASLPALQPWMPWAMEPMDAEAYEVYVRKQHLKFLAREDLGLLILLKDGGTIIGGTGLHTLDWEVPKFEIGYWVRTGYEGQGYVTEAVLGVVDFAFRELNAERLEIQCDASNVRSAAVARRAGFVLEAHQKREARNHYNGELRDTLLFALLRE